MSRCQWLHFVKQACAYNKVHCPFCLVTYGVKWHIKIHGMTTYVDNLLCFICWLLVLQNFWINYWRFGTYIKCKLISRTWSTLVQFFLLSFSVFSLIVRSLKRLCTCKFLSKLLVGTLLLYIARWIVYERIQKNDLKILASWLSKQKML